jgi:hypothetical protein
MKNHSAAAQSLQKSKAALIKYFQAPMKSPLQIILPLLLGLLRVIGIPWGRRRGF